MVSELCLAKGLWFEPPLCNLLIWSSFVCKVHSGLRLVCLTFHVPGMGSYSKEGVKHDIHIIPKSYKLEHLGELVF